VGNGHGCHNDAALSLLGKNLRFEFGTVKTTVAPIGANPGPPKLVAHRHRDTSNPERGGIAKRSGQQQTKRQVLLLADLLPHQTLS
jgi:hypothetical protein